MKKVSLPPKKSGSKRSKTLLLAAPAACLWTWTCEQRLLRAAQPPDSHENHRDSNPKSWPREPRNEHLVVWEKSCPVETSTSQTACGSEHHSFYMDAESRPLRIGEKGQIGWSLRWQQSPGFGLVSRVLFPRRKCRSLCLDCGTPPFWPGGLHSILSSSEETFGWRVISTN